MKKLLPAVLAMLILLTACGESKNTLKTDSDIAEYKSLITECNKVIMDESILLSNMGQYEYEYWKALSNIGGEVDSDSMVAESKAWLSDEAEIDAGTLEENYNGICDQYKEIIKIDVSGTEVEEIKDNYIELFNAFNELYILITSPSGDVSTFADNFNEYSDNIKNYSSTLSILVSD